MASEAPNHGPTRTGGSAASQTRGKVHVGNSAASQPCKEMKKVRNELSTTKKEATH